MGTSLKGMRLLVKSGYGVPYIRGHWMSGDKGGAILALTLPTKPSRVYEVKCSHATAESFLKEVKNGHF